MSDHKDVAETMNHLLNAPYPFHNQHYKRIYEKSKIISNLYHCNICHLKLLGDKQLTEHNRCLIHQIEIEKLYSEMLDKSTDSRTVPSVAVAKPSRMTKSMLRNAAINASKMKLAEEWAKLKCDYEQYERDPHMHPMYAKEWKIFYFRTLADITAANEDPNTYDFATHWQKYWKQRIQVYHNKSRQKVLEEIAANYDGAEFCSDSEPPSSDERCKTSRSTSSASTYTDVFDLTGDGRSSNPRSNEADFTLSDMDISNGSMCEDKTKDHVVTAPCTPAPKSKASPKPKPKPKQPGHVVRCTKDDLESTMRTTVTTAFATHAINVAVMQLTLEYLDKCNLNPDELTDDQLKTYIEYVIDTKYYERNLRSQSVESQSSVDSSHSR